MFVELYDGRIAFHYAKGDVIYVCLDYRKGRGGGSWYPVSKTVRPYTVQAILEFWGQVRTPAEAEQMIIAVVHRPTYTIRDAALGVDPKES